MWFIVSIVCFLLIVKLFKSLEVKDWKEWKPFKLVVWVWVLIVIACLIPVINITVTIVIYGITFMDTRLGDLRFKGGKKTWFDKFLDFLNKEI